MAQIFYENLFNPAILMPILMIGSSTGFSIVQLVTSHELKRFIKSKFEINL